MFLIDANIFLEVELAQEKKEACKRLLRKVREGREEAITTDFIIDSIIVIMENYGKSWSEIRKFLTSLLGYEGLRIYILSIYDRIAATEHMKIHKLDFDDATTHQAMQTSKITEIASYDEHFDKILGIKRIAP